MLIMPSDWLQSNKCHFKSHWFDSTRVRTHKVVIPRSPKMEINCSTHSVNPSGRHHVEMTITSRTSADININCEKCAHVTRIKLISLHLCPIHNSRIEQIFYSAGDIIVVVGWGLTSNWTYYILYSQSITDGQNLTMYRSVSTIQI